MCLRKAPLDLEWMKRIGLGGAHIFSGGVPQPQIVDKPLPLLSEGWNQVLRSSVARGRAAGLNMGIAGAPGWSVTGGVWVPPEDGMKKYVWSAKASELSRVPDGTKPWLGKSWT